MKATLFVVALAGLISACSRTVNEQKEYNSAVITESEISASGAATAYDAVKKLRSNFLVSRGKTSFNDGPPEPNVYVDENYFGPLASLKSIPAAQVGSIRLYRSWEVQAKYGTNNLGGVISVYTRQ